MKSPKEVRESLGLTQEQLGELVGLSRQVTTAIETDKHEPSTWLVDDICGIYNKFPSKH